MINLQLPSSLVSELKGVRLVDLRKSLPVNPHYTWAQLAGIRPIEQLNTIVCHHDAWPKAKSINYSDVQLAAKIAQDHINSKKHHTNGDPGFPYDLWIRNGTIYWCNDLEPREYGVASNNGYTVNVSVSGDYYHYDNMTDADRNALYVAILMLEEALPSFHYIKGHGEITPTKCPGYSMDKVRQDIEGLHIEIAYRNSAEYRTASVTSLAARVHQLQGMVARREPYWEDAERKLFTLYRLAEDYDLMDPMRKGKMY
jgi:hypothetical protein